MKKQQQQQIEKLKNNENVLQFALPKGGRGFVTKDNELFLAISGKLNSYGYFKKAINDDDDDDTYYFVYKTGIYDIPEEIHSMNKALVKDLYAFAIILGYFFDRHPSYKSTREHDLDVLLGSSLKLSSTINTPLYTAGFRIKAYSKN